MKTLKSYLTEIYTSDDSKNKGLGNPIPTLKRIQQLIKGLPELHKRFIRAISIRNKIINYQNKLGISKLILESEQKILSLSDEDLQKKWETSVKLEAFSIYTEGSQKELSASWNAEEKEMYQKLIKLYNPIDAEIVSIKNDLEKLWKI